MSRQRNGYSESSATESPSYSNPYPYFLPSEVPQLPVFNQQAWYMRRDQPLPPDIGFKLDILNALGDDAATTPYPEANELVAATDSSPYPSKQNEKSPETHHSNKSNDDADSSSDVDDSDSSVLRNESTRDGYLKRLTKFADESEDYDLFSQNVIEVEESKPQPSLKGAQIQFNRHGIPYPKEAYANIARTPCDHSGGDHMAHH